MKFDVRSQAQQTVVECNWNEELGQSVHCVVMLCGKCSEQVELEILPWHQVLARQEGLDLLCQLAMQV